MARDELNDKPGTKTALFSVSSCRSVVKSITILHHSAVSSNAFSDLYALVHVIKVLSSGIYRRVDLHLHATRFVLISSLVYY
jgi:hypothetical protein